MLWSFAVKHGYHLLVIHHIRAVHVLAKDVEACRTFVLFTLAIGSCPELVLISCAPICGEMWLADKSWYQSLLVQRLCGH